MNLKQLLETLDATFDERVVVGPPSSGECCAESCNEQATATTVIGLRFCDAHFSEFYTAGRGPRLKDGVVRTERVT